MRAVCESFLGGPWEVGVSWIRDVLRVAQAGADRPTLAARHHGRYGGEFQYRGVRERGVDDG